YLEAMDRAPYTGVAPPRPPDRVLAALGPRMLRLAAERTIGAHPYFVPVEHTALARKELGPGPLLAVEQAAVLSTDPSVARSTAAGSPPRPHGARGCRIGAPARRRSSAGATRRDGSARGA